jgi:hypothetical protein
METVTPCVTQFANHRWSMVLTWSTHRLLLWELPFVPQTMGTSCERDCRSGAFCTCVTVGKTSAERKCIVSTCATLSGLLDARVHEAVSHRFTAQLLALVECGCQVRIKQNTTVGTGGRGSSRASERRRIGEYMTLSGLFDARVLPLYMKLSAAQRACVATGGNVQAEHNSWCQAVREPSGS